MAAETTATTEPAVIGAFPKGTPAASARATSADAQTNALRTAAGANVAWTRIVVSPVAPARVTRPVQQQDNVKRLQPIVAMGRVAAVRIARTAKRIVGVVAETAPARVATMRIAEHAPPTAAVAATRFVTVLEIASRTASPIVEGGNAVTTGAMVLAEIAIRTRHVPHEDSASPLLRAVATIRATVTRTVRVVLPIVAALVAKSVGEGVANVLRFAMGESVAMTNVVEAVARVGVERHATMGAVSANLTARDVSAEMTAAEVRAGGVAEARNATSAQAAANAFPIAEDESAGTMVAVTRAAYVALGKSATRHGELANRTV